MPYRPRFNHLLKILLKRRDPMAAEGLFLEGKIEYESENVDQALLMFYYGRKLDPTFAGNFYNYAVALEKKDGKTNQAYRAWQEYIAVAEKDARQPRDTIKAIKSHLIEFPENIRT